MGFFDRVTGGKSDTIPSSATFRLTEQGRDKLQEFSGDPKSQILVALETRGTSNLEEIASASRLSRGQVERLLPALIKGGYIQRVSAQQEDY